MKSFANEERKQNKMKSISVKDNIVFRRSVDVINQCFGKEYGAWMRACYHPTPEERVWFPKLAVLENGQYVAQEKVYGCINTLSADGLEIRERHSTACGAVDNCVRYVFMKDAHKQEYRFVGVFAKNYIKSGPDVAVYDRVSDTLDLSRWD